ncbi:hypothetical protein [Flavivirga spongiicola]|uniref:Capsular biosynthesis protein n=1 Tax=Flavivirga spongiicola TaxID=421621 RepID=A0ABU7XTL2_9FLAO|nr:hypothetical protein [Flavivirga sp. MEBiC05379]MDO5978842.1 hypothetical protein [Flavivirga sp. MEBiC05379]
MSFTKNKIIIIESRDNVKIWDEVFDENFCNRNNVEIHFLIFNKLFSSRSGNNHFINNGVSDKKIDVPINYDRQRNYFGSNRTDYYVYYKSMKDKITEINPNFIFGEAASFQDYLAIKICREVNIMYLNPMTSRYPIGRFAFYKEDTLVPFLGSNENLSDSKLEELYNQITNKKVVPDYMIKKNYKLKTKQKFKDLLVKVIAYRNGDKNTPSPFHYIKRTVKNKANQSRVKKISIKTLPKTKSFKILYPMQMQPESNIDVYGHPFNNQLEIIKELSKQLQEDDELIIKPNPKPFMEITSGLIDFISTNEKVSILNFDISMGEIFKDINMVVTVTGTIAIECILINKPLIALKSTYFNTTKNSIVMKSYNEIKEIISSIKNGNYPTMPYRQRLEYLNYLNKISYQGIIGSLNMSADKTAVLKNSFELFFLQNKD